MKDMNEASVESVVMPHTARSLLDAALAEIIRLKSAWCDALGIEPECSGTAMMIEDHLRAEREWVTWDRVTHAESDIWFWWNGEQSFPVNIMRDSDGRFFACVGQWGWTRAQFLSEMGGLWFRCICPYPSEQAQESA